MIHAHKQNDGTYVLTGKTYPIKERIKKLGGRWDGKKWTVPANTDLTQIPAEEMVLVFHEAYCHESAGIWYVPESDLKRGFHKSGCSLCDTSYIYGENVKIRPLTEKEIEDFDKNNLTTNNITTSLLQTEINQLTSKTLYMEFKEKIENLQTFHIEYCKKHRKPDTHIISGKGDSEMIKYWLSAEFGLYQYDEPRSLKNAMTEANHLFRILKQRV